MKWRQMTATDLDDVNRIADQVHVNYPEDPAVFAERQALFPKGCLILGGPSEIGGYAISHPWHYKQPPELNVLLRALPDHPTTFYIHDIALLPTARGAGHASKGVEQLFEIATSSGLPNISLIAVNNSQQFWAKLGFKVLDDPDLRPKLRSYDDDARFMVRSATV